MSIQDLVHLFDKYLLSTTTAKELCLVKWFNNEQ